MTSKDGSMTARLGTKQGASGFPPSHIENHLTAPDENAVNLGGPRGARPPFRIEIQALDGTPLLVLREQDGYLIVEGDESRWPEATMRFLQGMRQWSGQTGLRWQAEVEKAAGQ